MNFNPDDPKWTAYILGELDASERAAEKAAIEEMLASSEEARAYLDELRMAADALEFSWSMKLLFAVSGGPTIGIDTSITA